MRVGYHKKDLIVVIIRSQSFIIILILSLISCILFWTKMYDNVWFKDIKEVNLASGNQGSGLNDLAVVELSEAIEPE